MLDRWRRTFVEERYAELVRQARAIFVGVDGLQLCLGSKRFVVAGLRQVEVEFDIVGGDQIRQVVREQVGVRIIELQEASSPGVGA